MSLGDLFYHLGQWINTTQAPEIALRIQKTWISNFIDKNFWFIPALQTIHILAIAMTFGSVLMINLRIFQMAGRNRNMGQIVHRYLPWVWGGLVVLLATGIGMTLGEPVRELTNACFWLKMILIIVASLIALWFGSSVSHNAPRWQLTGGGQLGLRAGATGVIVLWCLIMVLGRWIAYAPT